MNAILRPGTPEDATACGAICFEAFKAIANEHNFPWDFPSVEVAAGLMNLLLAHPGFYSVVAEHDVALRDFRLLEPGTVPRTSSGKVARGAARAAFLAEQDARR